MGEQIGDGDGDGDGDGADRKRPSQRKQSRQRERIVPGGKPIIETRLSPRLELPMRRMLDEQMPLVQRWVNHPHAHEYMLMSKVLDDAPDALKVVYECLVRVGGDPKRGRDTLTAEQVLRVLVVKMHENLSYEKLSFALADSTTFRSFCRLSQDRVPSKSVRVPRCRAPHGRARGPARRDGKRGPDALRLHGN
jgi:hypothetical protein